MTNKITRRKALAVSSAASITLLGATNTDNAHAWPPGPDKNLVRDLTPGNTPIRLGTDLVRRENESVTEMVRRIRENGHTGTFIYKSYWWPENESEMKELTAALKEFDVTVFEVGGYVNMLHPDNATRARFLKRLATCIENAEKLDGPMVGVSILE